jgi:transcriptional regulator GlxA family with amidase domain
VNNFVRILIEKRISERITFMSENSSPIDLLTVRNWRETAAEVHYKAPVLAKHWNMHPRRLQREFHRQLNTTPQRHLNEIRIAVAKELALKQMRTKEIRVRLEYKHDSHLCRQFHAIVGVGLKTFRHSTKAD